MKELKGFFLILLCLFLGDLLFVILPIPIPGAIFGIILGLIFLFTGILKIEQIEAAGNFLLKHIALFFIPSAVKLIEVYPLIQEDLLKLILLIVVTACLVIVTTGLTVQALVRWKEDK